MSLVRFPDGLELRIVPMLRAAGGRKLTGYAALFNTRATIGGAFNETILPGAFTASLADPASDVLALVDHDAAKLLGRTRSGTLRLNEDGRGLKFEVDCPDTQLGRDVVTMVQRGDVGGMSFGFRVNEDSWPTADLRELRAVALVEISVVHAFPAYVQTSVTARARRDEGAAARMRLWLQTV